MARKRQWLAIAGALGVGAFGAPVTAGATDLGTVDGISYVGAPSSATPPASVAGDAFCPNGTSPLGGGFWGGNTSAASRIYNAYPADLLKPFGSQMRDTYRSIVWAPSGPMTQVEGFGICSGAQPTYRVDVGTLPATPQELTLTANCPAEMHVAGGGAAAGQGGSIAGAYVNSSYPIDDGDRNSAADDGWRARIYGTDQSNAAAVAVCVETKPRYRRFRSSSFQILVFDCPSDRHVLGIGLQVHGNPAKGWVHSAFPGDSVDDQDDTPDDTVVFDVSSVEDRTVTAHAVCG